MAVNSTDDKLERAQDLLEYRFHDPGLLRLALRHASALGEQRESNQRLEFLGDSVLSLVVAHDLYELFPDRPEGDLTRIKSSVVSSAGLVSVAAGLHLDEFIEVGGGLMDRNALPESILADTLEAVMGAVYLDGGLDAARRFILKNVEELVESVLGDEHPRNYKSILQHLCQVRYGCMPRYEIRRQEGPDHSKEFEAVVFLGELEGESAWGRCKKDAEQLAALHSLQRDFPEWQKYHL